MAAVDPDTLRSLWNDPDVSIRELAALLKASPATLMRASRALGLARRPVEAENVYSADAPPIGVDRDHLVTIERDRRSCEIELQRLRERASRPAYG